MRIDFNSASEFSRENIYRSFWWCVLSNIILVLVLRFSNIYMLSLWTYVLLFIVILVVIIVTFNTLNSFNYLVSLVFLIFLFSISGLCFMFFGLNFLGLTLIAVYVGGVLLLFLSVIKFLGFRAGEHLFFSDFYLGVYNWFFEFFYFLIFFSIFLNIVFMTWNWNINPVDFVHILGK